MRTCDRCNMEKRDYGFFSATATTCVPCSGTSATSPQKSNVLRVTDLPMAVRMAVAKADISNRLRIFKNSYGPGYVAGVHHHINRRWKTLGRGSSPEEAALAAARERDRFRKEKSSATSSYCATCGEPVALNENGKPRACPRCPNIIRNVRRRRNEHGASVSRVFMGGTKGATNISADDELLDFKQVKKLLGRSNDIRRHLKGLGSARGFHRTVLYKKCDIVALRTSLEITRDSHISSR